MEVMTSHAFVLMGNHFHHLWSPCVSSEKSAFEAFAEVVSKELNEPTFIWEESVFSIDSFFQYRETYKYIYRNPVQAGLVACVEEYKYSTIQNVLGRDRVVIGLQDPFGLIFDQFRQLRWLNSPQNSFAVMSN